ncbi:hypothetical protein QTP70_029991, partial [Hemibagrus guttatus]
LTSSHITARLTSSHITARLTSSHPHCQAHILTSSLPGSHPHISLPGSHPHILTARLTSSHPHCQAHILTSSLPGSHPHILTARLTSSHPHCQAHILTSSLPGSHPHILTARLTSSHPHCQAHILTSSLPGSHPHILTSSLPGSHPHILTARLTSSHPHCQAHILTARLTSSHPHCQAHILTSSLPGSHPHILTARLTSSHPHCQAHILTSSHPHCQAHILTARLTSSYIISCINLEKAYDRVPREELWYCMRKSGVAEKYVRVVQDMYERSRTVVRCAVGQTEEFNVEVGLHQGSALSPFLFAIVMDQLSEEVRQESPWTMMFADDIVICSESREQVEENLERWRFALERRGMKVSRSKTEYMCVNEREGSGTVRLQGEEVKKVQEFKYLGSTVQSNGECGKEVKKRVQAGWNGWRKVWGVLCDRKISARIKGKVYRTVVRPAMLYGLETVSLRKRQESELEVAELKMLRFSLGVTRLDRIRNEYIRGTAHVGRLGDKVREARLRWFGHVQRRETPRYPSAAKNWLYIYLFIMAPNPEISYLDRVVMEIMETEHTYVRDLHSIVEGYLAHIIDTADLPIIPEQVCALFGNIEVIYEFNSELLQELDLCKNDPVAIARCFVLKR